MKRVLLADGSAVDVAAHRAESTELLLLAYRYTPAEFVEETALSIQSILDGYPAETSGTLFIVQNNQVVAANRPELIGQDVAGSPLAQGIRKAGAAEKLTYTRDWNGSGCYFGMFCHGRSFDLYAYTDEKIIFRESLLRILTVLVGYILLVMVLQLLRRRSAQEMELQKKEQERKYQTQLEEQNHKLEIALQHEGAANRAKREIGKALMVSDILIVLAAAWRFGMGTGLYCILGLIGKSFVVDGAIENIRLRKVCTIVTSNPQPILDFIIKEMNRSATVEKAYGAYTHHELSVLVTVLTRRQALQLRNFLRENDPRSFITIVNSSEIIGKGFRSFN